MKKYTNQPCNKTYVEFHLSGKIVYCLDRPTTHGGGLLRTLNNKLPFKNY